MNASSVSADPSGSLGREGRARSLLVLIAVLAFAAAVLFLFRSETQSGDSLEYARSVRSGTNLFHPHHLLFNPIIRGVWLSLRFLFPSASPLDAAQAHNIFWALVVLAAVFEIVRRMTASAAAAVLFSLGLFVCLGFWRYATLAEVYLPAMGCLVLILALLRLPRPGPPKAGFLLSLLALFCLAVLYNQISVLFAIPFVFLSARRLGPKGWLRAGALIAVSGAIVLAAYAAAFLTTSNPKTVSGFVHWCLLYAFYPDPRWGTMSNFSVMGGAKLLLSIARNVFDVPPSLFLPAAIAAGLVLAVLIGCSVRALVRRAPEADFRLALLIWLGVTFAFIWWFTPYGFELYIPLLPLFFFLAARLVADRREAASRPPRIRPLTVVFFAAAVAGVGILNLVTAVLPAQADRGPDYARAAGLDASAPSEAILIADFELRENLLYYFERPATLEDGPILYSFYRHWSLPPMDVLKAGLPVLVAAALAVPDSTAAKPYNGESHPREWRSFIEWLLDCDIRDGRVIAARVPSAAAGLPGYLLLSGERSPVAGLAEMFRRLDEAVAGASKSSEGPFSAWLVRHPDLAR